jgi:hypothetical protein
VFNQDNVHLQDSDAKADDQPNSLGQTKLYLPEVVYWPEVNHEIRYTIHGGDGNEELLGIDALLFTIWLENRPDIRKRSGSRQRGLL